MKYGECRINNDYGYLVPLSDVHIGDPQFMDGGGHDLFCRNVEWIEREPHTYTFINGDLLNVATRISASNPVTQSMSLEHQIDFAVKILRPLAEKGKIIGAIDGNHEERLERFVGYSPMIAVCHILKIDYYRYSAVINFIVGKGRYGKFAYAGYFSHTTGGGSTVGGKMNRVDKLRDIVCNCDFYVGSHNHQLGVIPVETYAVDISHKKITALRQLLVASGGYVSYEDNYPEEKMFPPTKLGSPRIRLDGKRSDIHCSV